MSLDELYAQYPGLNPAVWRPLIWPADGAEEPFAVEPLLPVVEVEPRAPQNNPTDDCRRKSDFRLPQARELGDGRVDFPEQLRAGASSMQLQKAAAMHAFGLCSKARRQASCGVYARMRSCENGHQFYSRYGCKNRYCVDALCGRRAFLDLFNKYMGLDAVAQQMVPNWENRPHRKARPGDFVIALIDITIRSDDRMPSNKKGRRFNSDIRKLFRAAEKEFALTYPKRIKVDGHLVAARVPRRGDYGVIWTDEFGGKATRPGKAGNTNLHAHAVYCGPYIPQGWLSGQWAKIRADGSKIVSIKIARTFRAGLYHALKYAGKMLSTDPIRLAELELAFHRVRRVHTMAGFYNAIPKGSAPKSASPPCSVCGGVMLEATGPLRPVGHFELLGIPDFELVRREVARQRVLAGMPEDA